MLSFVKVFKVSIWRPFAFKGVTLKRLILALALLFSMNAAIAQRPALTPPVIRFQDINGKPLVGGQLFSYAAGTTTPLATFVDATTSALNANPTILDSTGSARVFLGAAVYKFVLEDANGVIQWTADNIAQGAFESSTVLSFTGNQGTTRTGAVAAIAGDYTCAMVTNCPTLPTPVTLYNQTIQVAGSSVAQEPKLNFIAGILGSVTSPTITAGGSGYTGAPTATFTGGTCSVEPTGSTNLSVGVINSPTVTAGGTGYTSAPTVVFSGGGGTGAAATAVVSGGVVTAITITSRGSGYTSAPGVAFTGGAGTGAAATVGFVPAGSVLSLTLTTAGSGCATAPTVALSGGGGTGATATVALQSSILACVDNPAATSTDCTFPIGGSGGIGSAYTLTDVTASRSGGVPYQNTTNSIMFISGALRTSGGGTGTAHVFEGPTSPSQEILPAQTNATTSGGNAPFSGAILPGYFYSVTGDGAVSNTASLWVEITGGGGGGGGGPTLKTNGTNNGSQTILNLKAGTNVTIVDDGVGGITFSAAGGSGGTPGGANHGVQFNAASSFGGTAFTGILKASTSADPAAATSLDLAAINGVVTNPAGSQNVNTPVGSFFSLTGSLNDNFDPTQLPATTVQPSTTLSPNSVWVQYPFELVTVQHSGATSQLNVYNISTGVQVLVGSPTTFTGCQFLNGVVATNIAGVNVVFTVCNDNATGYAFSLSSSGVLTAIGSPMTGLTAASPGIALDPDGVHVYVPLFGVSSSATGSIAKVLLSSTSSPTMVGSPMAVASFNGCGGTAGNSSQNPAYLVVADGYGFVETGHEPTTACVLDSTIQAFNTSTMALVGSVLPVAHSPQQLSKQGSTLFASYFDALQIQSFDISNPASITSLQILSTPSANLVPIITRGSRTFAGVQGGADVGDVYELDTSNPSDMRLIQKFTGFVDPQRFFLDGRNLFVVEAGVGHLVAMADTGGTYLQQLAVTNGYIDHLEVRDFNANSGHFSDSLVSVGPGSFGAGSTAGGSPIITTGATTATNIPQFDGVHSIQSGLFNGVVLSSVDTLVTADTSILGLGNSGNGTSMQGAQLSHVANGAASDDAAAFGQLGTKQINTVSAPLAFSSGTLSIAQATNAALGAMRGDGATISCVAGVCTATTGGTGTVTSFSAGTLSPLFTTSVATATSTPALTFTLTNAAQNSVFAGPATGGSGAPSYQTAPTFSAANLTSFPTLNQSTTGNATTATALATARAINGVNFDGTAAITVAAAAGTLTGTTIASGVTAAAQTWTGVQTFSQSTSSANAVQILNPSAATNLVNPQSPSLWFVDHYWNSTTSITNTWSFDNIFGTGSNPTSTFNIAQTGTSGFSAVQVPQLIISGLSSGTSPVCPNGTNNALTTSGCIITTPLSCQPGVGDGLNAVPAGTYLTSTCKNETGRTWTITAIRCVADAGSSTCNATNGAGTGLLTGAITGTSTYANGTQSGTTTIVSGDFIKITYVADGTSKQIGIDVAGTF